MFAVIVFVWYWGLLDTDGIVVLSTTDGALFDRIDARVCRINRVSQHLLCCFFQFLSVNTAVCEFVFDCPVSQFSLNQFRLAFAVTATTQAGGGC